MKIFSLLLTLYSVSAFAGKELRLEQMDYIVQSDSIDTAIDSGYFRLSGEVKMFSSLSPLEAVLSGCTSSGIWTRTDTDGKFDLLLKSTDSVIYFYLDGWTEVVIEDYDFKEGHHITMDVYMNQVRKPGQEIMVRKPVMYLYADQNIEGSIKIKPQGELTFSYPTYDKSWEFELKEDQLLVGNQEYPYLFWEAKTDDLNYKFNKISIEGAIVKTSELTSFFETKLKEMGLNAIEMTDFITYWVPALSEKEFCFIQFLVDEDYDSEICSLEMNPAPESSKRIFLLASPLDSPDVGLKVIRQDLSSFERNGLTLVEWGGSIIDFYRLGH
ncbi:MAG: hypothetical protein ABJG68_10035 [Crocinitomicaceae bacterium]